MTVAPGSADSVRGGQEPQESYAPHQSLQPRRMETEDRLLGTPMESGYSYLLGGGVSQAVPGPN